MFIIEFIAPAGAGKTTICTELEKNKNIIFLSQNIAWLSKFIPLRLLLIFKKASIRNKKHYRYIEKILNLFFFRQAINLKENLTNGELEECSQLYIAECIKYFSDSLEAKDAASRLSFFLDSAIKFSLSRKSTLNEIVLFDEGLAQRGTSLAYQGVCNDTITNYFKKTPLPDLLVVLDIKEASLDARLDARGGGNDKHYQLMRRAIETTECCKTIYNWRGCPTLVLNATFSVDHNTKIIVDEVIKRLKE